MRRLPVGVALAVACAGRWAGIPPLPDVDYQVYRTGLTTLRPDPSGALYVLETLGPLPIDSTLVPSLPAEYQGALTALRRAEPRRLQPTYLPEATLHPVSFEDYRRAIQGPDSVLTLSRIGYSSDSTRAVFYLAATCRFCATSDLVLLDRDSSKTWTVVGVRILWTQAGP